MGTWHGDWTPGNVPSVRWTDLGCGDWEHAAEDVPLGYDALHYAFALQLDVARLSSVEAVAVLRNDSDPP